MKGVNDFSKGSKVIDDQTRVAKNKVIDRNNPEKPDKGVSKPSPIIQTARFAKRVTVESVESFNEGTDSQSNITMEKSYELGGKAVIGAGKAIVNTPKPSKEAVEAVRKIKVKQYAKKQEKALEDFAKQNKIKRTGDIGFGEVTVSSQDAKSTATTDKKEILKKVQTKHFVENKERKLEDFAKQNKVKRTGEIDFDEIVEEKSNLPALPDAKKNYLNETLIRTRNSYSLEDFEKKFKITNRNVSDVVEKTGIIKKGEAKTNTVFASKKEKLPAVYGTYGDNARYSKNDKVKKKNTKGGKNKKDKNKKKDISLRKHAVERGRRDAINFLVKPGTEEDNNLSSGFAKSILNLASEAGKHLIGMLLKSLLLALGHLVCSVIYALLFVIAAILPIIIPMIAVAALITTTFGYFLGGEDMSVQKANDYYVGKVLNQKYDEFDANNRSWVLKNVNGETGYRLNYVDPRDRDTFGDAMMLYLTFTFDKDNTDTLDYLIIDTDGERAALDRAFKLLNYTTDADKTRNVYKKTLDDVKGSLSDEEKNILETERELSDGYELPDHREPKTVDGDEVSVSGQNGAAIDFAISKVGSPYSQPLRNDGYHFDCSSLVYYAWLNAGVDISHCGATTAAEEARGLDEQGKTVSQENIQPGDLIFYSFESNGSYKNISHVAIYIGNGKIVEAANERKGVIYHDVYWNHMVEICRPN